MNRAVLTTQVGTESKDRTQGGHRKASAEKAQMQRLSPSCQWSGELDRSSTSPTSLYHGRGMGGRIGRGANAGGKETLDSAWGPVSAQKLALLWALFESKIVPDPNLPGEDFEPLLNSIPALLLQTTPLTPNFSADSNMNHCLPL